MLPEDLITEETVRLYVKNASRRGHAYIHPDWRTSLFAGSYREIVETLFKRLVETKEPEEYYGILPYLVGHVKAEKLLKPYHKRTKHLVLDESTFKTNMRKPRKFRDILEK